MVVDVWALCHVCCVHCAGYALQYPTPYSPPNSAAPLTSTPPPLHGRLPHAPPPRSQTRTRRRRERALGRAQRFPPAVKARTAGSRGGVAVARSRAAQHSGGSGVALRTELPQSLLSSLARPCAFRCRRNVNSAPAATPLEVYLTTARRTRLSKLATSAAKVGSRPRVYGPRRFLPAGACGAPRWAGRGGSRISLRAEAELRCRRK